MRRPFKFGGVKLTDDDSLAISDEKILKGIGSIEARICRVTILENSSSSSYTYDSEKGIPTLHEQQKKATISHVTELGAAEYSPKGPSMNVKRIDTYEKPWLTLTMMYRSRVLLETGGIVSGRSTHPSNSYARPSLISLSLPW